MFYLPVWDAMKDMVTQKLLGALQDRAVFLTSDEGKDGRRDMNVAVPDGVPVVRVCNCGQSAGECGALGHGS